MTGYKSEHPLPTPYEAEILTNLVEECSEVVKECCKFLRFGGGDVDPRNPSAGPNYIKLSVELGNVLAMLEKCVEAGLADPQAVHRGEVEKRSKFLHFLQHEETER